jgi:hypothetical protein
MTREEVMTIIQDCAAQMGRAPNLDDLKRTAKISLRQIRKNFGSYRGALDACGLVRRGAGYRVGENDLFIEWATIVRKLGKVPTAKDWDAAAQYSITPLRKRFGTLSSAPLGLLEYARKNGLESEWEDVMEITVAYLNSLPLPDMKFKAVTCAPPKPGVLMNQPIYGTPLIPWALTYAPTNEIGVVFLFGTVAQELGYAVTRMQTEFPDGEAMRKVDEGRWQRVRIEFEFESRNFQAHFHRPEGCDLIVCWSHNWPECPLEVLELKTVIGQRWEKPN